MILTGNLSVLFGAFAFIVGMQLMGKPKSAFKGNYMLVIGMIAAIIGTVLIQMVEINHFPWARLGILLCLLSLGTFVGKRVSSRFQLTKMPELVSLFNGLGGLAAGLISLVGIIQVLQAGTSSINMSLLMLSIMLGFFTFSSSMVAFAKLSGHYNWQLKFTRLINKFLLIINLTFVIIAFFSITPEITLLVALILTLTGLAHGVSFADGIGGGDMPILISVLNGITGLLTTVSGVYFGSTVMLLSGVFIGTTGVILTIQMCGAMNTTLTKVLFNNTTTKKLAATNNEYEELVETTSEKIASDLIFLEKVVIVPGFGLAAAKAQKACRELKDLLAERGIELKFIIHPVAGRMPGHMNVLLAEVGIEYEDILDIDDGNLYLSQTDLCFVIGANDVVNIAAENDPNSSLYGMPIIQTYKANKVVVVKRGLSPGYAGIKNSLFENANTRLLFLDAKSAIETIIKNFKLI